MTLALSNNSLTVLKNTDFSWAAGIIEGEGCIGVYSDKRGKTGSRYYLMLVVGNTDYGMLLELQTIFGGGSIVSVNQERRKAHWKQSWRWSLFGLSAKRALDLIYPFLRTCKKQQAELAIEYASKYSNYNANGHSRSPTEKEDQLEYYNKLRDLKVQETWHN